VSSSRAVRISRPSLAEAPSPPSGLSRSGIVFVPNRVGEQRGVRLFLVFVLFALVVYATFVALAASSPVPGVRTNPAIYGVLSLVALLIAATGFLITLGRAPRALAWREEHLVVRERLGRLRRFRRDSLRVMVVYRYPAGLLSSEPTVLATVSDADGRLRNYLVGQGFLESEAGP
jgi:hypothetical protein